MFGFKSPSSVSWLVHSWVKQDLVKVDDKKIAPTDEFFRLPLLGIIKAGSPTLEEGYQTESFSLDKYLVGNPGYTYLLRVSGDSMKDEGIKEGDLVILDKKKEPKNGDIVAAYIDQEWTLKYFIRKNRRVYLEAANKKYHPLIPKRSLEIGGVVVHVIRSYQ